MLNSVSLFEDSIREARNLSSLYDYLSNQIAVPFAFDDLLRAQLVYCVGAFDKLMHDIIRIGMRETYKGNRVPTARYLSDTISMQLHTNLVGASVPPPEFIFETEVVKKLGYLSFQKPKNIAEGLSLIWDEKHKWDVISTAMGLSADDVRYKVGFYSDRRNAIVHESDMNPMSNNKSSIDKPFVEDAAIFIEKCGQTIVTLVA